jgi:hypothetical protein
MLPNVHPRLGATPMPFDRRCQLASHRGWRRYGPELLDQPGRALGARASIRLDQPFDDFAQRHRDLGRDIDQ